MVKLEVGKYYKTRDGRKVGPCESSDLPRRYEFGGDWDLCHWSDGTYCGDDRSLDIVSEWYSSCRAAQVDVQRDEYGPFRTSREIVPGTYGRVNVLRVSNGSDRVKRVGLKFDVSECFMTAEELREAAHLFNQLAEALDDNRA